jgi:YozE SAM-like fold
VDSVEIRLPGCRDRNERSPGANGKPQPGELLVRLVPCRQVLRIHAKDLLFYFCRCALVMPSPPASSISVVTEHAGATPRLVMSKTTFKVWLAAAHVTNDPIGDFVSDARQDAQLPETITSAARLRGYLRTRHASQEVLATVPAIWRRFQHWRDQRRCRNRKRENRETGKASGGRRDYSNG